MPLTGELFFLDLFDDTDFTHLPAHTADIDGGLFWGLPWFGRLEIIDNKCKVPSGFAVGTYSHQVTAADPAYCETVIKFTLTSPATTGTAIRFGDQATFLSRWQAEWRPNIDGVQGSIRLSYNLSPGFFISTNIPKLSTGQHQIRIIGQGEVIKVYFDNFGLRVTDIPLGARDYDHIGLLITGNVEVDLMYGKNGIEEDFVLYFWSS